ncbi:MAG: autotransporter-associated beta strand repeat-containing protein [Thermoguttaceae bacterium]|nr:autotransporter-associated beta strand repeat-containing protein [Thermoguttaceae bacterium]
MRRMSCPATTVRFCPSHLLLVSALCAPLSTHAGTITWSGAASSDFEIGANWNGGAAPVDDLATDTAVFGLKGAAQNPALSKGRSIYGVNFTDGGWTLGGPYTLTVGAGGINSSAASGTIVISANIGGTGGVAKSGATSTLTLSGANTYTGKTTLAGGHSSHLYFNSIGNLGAGPSALGNPTDEANGAITYLTHAQLRYTGTGHATNRKLELLATSFCILDAGGTGALVWNGGVIVPTTGTRTFSLRGSSTADNTFNGLIADGSGTVNFELYAPSGRWIIGNNANNYTGTTHIAGGTLTVSSLADAGQNSALGAATGANAAIRMGYATTTGTLRYVGTGHSTNRPVNFVADGTAGGTIDASGTGALVFTGNFTGTGGSAAKTLTLTGTSASHLLNTISGAISDSAGGPTSLVKSGSNTWVLSGANTYTGTTTLGGGNVHFNSIGNVGAGASALGAPETAANGTIRIASSMTLRYTGPGAVTDRNLEFTAAGSTRLGFESNGTGPLVWNGNLSPTGSANTTSFLSLRGTYVGTNEFNGLLSDGPGGHKLSLELYTSSPTRIWKIGRNDHTFSGEAFLARGILIVDKLADAGTPSSLGTGAAVPTIKIGWQNNTPILRYIGTGDSTNRPVSVGSTNDGGGSGGALIEANGTGALVFTGNFTGPATNGTAKTLILAGTSDPGLLNAITGAISDGNTAAGRTTSLVKADDNTWVLSGANVYTGTTRVEGGTLLVNGTHTGGGAYTVQADATLGGTGAIHAPIGIAAAGRLAPGTSPGILSVFGDVTFAADSFFDVVLNGTEPGMDHSQLYLDGVLDLTNSQLAVTLGFAPQIGDLFTIIDNAGAGAVIGSFAGLDEGTKFWVDFSGGSQEFLISYLGGDGNNVVLKAVPEPSSLFLLVCLAGMLLGMRRR